MSIRIVNIDFVAGSVTLMISPDESSHTREAVEAVLSTCHQRGLDDIRVVDCPGVDANLRKAFTAIIRRHNATIIQPESVPEHPPQEALYSTRYGKRTCATEDGPIDYHLRLSDSQHAVSRATTASILTGIACGLDDATRGHLRLCIYELTINTVEHGSFDNINPEIVLDVRVAHDTVALTYRDNSSVFVTGSHMHIDVAEKIQTGDKRGIGLFLLNKLAASIEYRRLGKWNLTNIVLARRTSGLYDEQRRSTMEGVTVEVVPYEQAGTVILKPSGSIDSSSTHVIESQIESLITQNNTRIVIDFSDVSFVSSAGVGVFLGSVARLRNSGGDLIFMKTPTHIQEVFEIINLKSYFMTIESMDDLNTVPAGE